MKKAFISTIILTALLLSGCQDKESQAEVEQQNQFISRLTEENSALKNELNSLKAQQTAMIPAIFAEPQMVFEKSERVKFRGSDELPEQGEGTLIYGIYTLNTNLPWLNDLLLRQLPMSEEMKKRNHNLEQLGAYYQKDYEESKQAMEEDHILGIENSSSIDFIGQFGKLATFGIISYVYGGGAHGEGAEDYVTVDLSTQKTLMLNDLFSNASLDDVKEALWSQYTDFGKTKDDETFTDKKDFHVTENFYLNKYGIVFSYPVYAIAPYAAGPQELSLNWETLQRFLKDEFKQQYRSSLGLTDKKQDMTLR